MEEVKVLWFNKNKGFGEGLNNKNNKIFLHYSNIQTKDKFINLFENQTIYCKVDEEDGELQATDIYLTPEKSLF